MTKYYRVRTQEQWDWLMNKLGVKNISFKNWSSELTRNYDFVIKYGAEGIAEFVSENGLHNEARVIEVSQMMEGEKMENYVTIKGEVLKNVEMFCGNELKGNLGEFWDISKVNISKPLLYPKVPMSVAEKKEFDELKSDWQVLICAFDAINEIDYPRWFSRLNDYPDDNNEHQLEFARAWADPSLIEIVEEPKYNIEVPETGGLLFYVKNHENCGVGTKSENNLSDQQFTEKEIIQHELSKYTRVKAPKQES